MRLSFSPLRKRILSEVQKSGVPVNALKIHARIGKKIAFSTIYRGLKFLEESGYIEGFSFQCEPCGKDKYFVDVKRGHVHFFHCEKCHSFIETGDCEICIPEVEKTYGFEIKRHLLVFSGLCKSCRRKK